MKFYKFINESDYYNINLDELCFNIKTDCSDIYNFYKNNKYHHLYRAIHANDETLKIFPRTDRKPRDTNIDLHNLINEFLKELTGYRLRSEAIFATFSMETAAKYQNGGGYIIYPVNGSKYFGSEHIVDMFNDIQHFDARELARYRKSNIKNDINYIYDKLFQNDVFKYLSTIKNISNQLIDFINLENEIMIVCKYFYAIRRDIVIKNFDKIYDIKR